MRNKISEKPWLRVAAVVLAMAVTFTFSVPDVHAASAGKVKSVTVTNLPAKELTLKKGKTKTLKVTVKTSSKKISKKVTFKSSKPKIATVSSAGKIKAKKNGKTNIIVASKADKKKKTVIKVTVGTPATAVKMNKTSQTVITNKTVALKATVSPSKASNKKVVWKTSNAKVATVSSNGVVTGVKAGTATITATAADGSGKKATCKVNVKNPTTIQSVSILNKNMLQVKLSAAQNLTAADFMVKEKKCVDGAYNRSKVIESVVTSDKINYIITLDVGDYMMERDYVQVTVKNLFGTGTAAKEVMYREGVFNYQDNSYVFTATQGEYFNDSIYDDGWGYSSYSVSGLPAGIKYDIRQNQICFSGKPSAAGNFTSKVVAKDEVGNTITYTVNWAIGSSSKIAAAFVPGYTLIGNSPVSFSKNGHVAGGSGEYTYTLTGTTYGFSISDYGYVYGEVTKAGTYTLNVKVTDANNSELSTTAKLVIYVKAGKTISGTIKDMKGNGVPDVSVEATNKNKASLYSAYGYAESDEHGVYSMVVEDSTYDLKAYYNGAAAYRNAQKITADKTGLDLKLAVYPVIVTVNNNVNLNSGWYDANEIWRGYGNKLYLKAGTYKLTSKWESQLYKYEATINVQVPNMSSVVAAVTAVKKDIVGQIYAGTPLVVNVNEEVLYKFVPEQSGIYCFYSADNAGDPAACFYDAEGNDLVSDDDSADNSNFIFTYECEQGKEYYLGLRDYNDWSEFSVHVDLME